MVDVLRSDEDLAQPLRGALANALDGAGDPPIRLVKAKGSKRGATFDAETAQLRSDVHPTIEQRLSLADAIDPKADPPVKLLVKKMGGSKGGPRPRAATMFDRKHKAAELLLAQEAKMADGFDYDGALEICIEEINLAAGRVVLNDSDARRMLADERANRDLSVAVGRAILDPGNSIEEIAAMISAPPRRKRGPRSAAVRRATERKSS